MTRKLMKLSKILTLIRFFEYFITFKNESIIAPLFYFENIKYLLQFLLCFYIHCIIILNESYLFWAEKAIYSLQSCLNYNFGYGKGKLFIQLIFSVLCQKHYISYINEDEFVVIKYSLPKIY